MAKKKSEYADIGYANSAHFLYYDLEARPDDYADITSVTAMVSGRIVLEIEDGTKGEIIDSLWQFIVKYCQSEACHIHDNEHYVKVIAHNGGGYDHLFLLGRLFSLPFYSAGWRFDSLNVVQGGHVKFMRLLNTINNKSLVIELIDTYAIFPSSLAEYGRVIGMPKLECLDWSDTDTIREYRRRDVEILYKYCVFVEREMAEFFDGKSCFGSYDKPIFTQSMLAKAVMRQIHKKAGDPFKYNERMYPMGGNNKLWEGLRYDSSIDNLRHLGLDLPHIEKNPTLQRMKSLDDFAKDFPGVKVSYADNTKVRINSGLGESRIGGLVSVLKTGYFPSITQLDVNSMYVGIMRKPLAYSFKAMVNNPSIESLKDYAFKGFEVFMMGYIEIPASMPIGIIPVKKGVTIRPTGSIFTGTFLAWELIEIALTFGAKVVPFQAIIFTKEPFAKGFADFIWNQRLEAKKQGNIGQDYVWKIVGNAMTGTWGQRPDHAVISSDLLTIGHRDDERSEKIPASVQPQTYTHITSIGQAMVLNVILANYGKVIYCDTDGLKFAVDSASKIDTCGIGIGKGLGQFKVEHENLPAIIADAKSYAIRTGETIILEENGIKKEYTNWDIKSKGIPDSVYLLHTIRNDNGTKKKYYDINAFFAMLCDYKAIGLRSIESYAGITNLLRESRESIPDDIWKKASVAEKETLLIDYAEEICKRKPYHPSNPSVYNRRNIIIDGFMPLEVRTEKALQYFRSRTTLHSDKLNWLDVYKHILATPDTEKTSSSIPHTSAVILIKQYSAVCVACNNDINIQLNIYHGARCSVCGSVNIELQVFNTMTTDIITMSEKFLLSCGFDRLRVTHKTVQTYGNHGVEYELIPDDDKADKELDE